MWELIRANRRKSLILFFLMGLCLVGLGAALGELAAPQGGWLIGMGIALTIWLIQSIISYAFGGSIMLAVSRAKPVTHDVHPQLFNVVEEMKIAANLPVMPKIYIIPDEAPNAFATGMKPQNSAIAVTAGLLTRCNRDELQGVVAHEMSHIINRDVLYLTFAGIMLGSIVMISHVFLRSIWYGGGHGRRYRSGGKGGGQAQLVLLILALLLAILAPILAHMLYYALSRKREYLADASAVRLTRYPEGLASALEKISRTGKKLESANKITAPMYISNPMAGDRRELSNWSSTHPPIRERIKILRNMSHGVNFADYQKTYESVVGKSAALIPASSLEDREDISIRQGTAEKPVKQLKKQDSRGVGDLMRAVNNYAFLACACGLKMKVPPDFKQSQISCPRCGRVNELPLAELAAAAAVLDRTASPGKKTDKPQDRKTLTYTRKGRGWESFSCTCGHLQQISPTFTAPEVECDRCGRKIIIKNS